MVDVIAAAFGQRLPVARYAPGVEADSVTAQSIFTRSERCAQRRLLIRRQEPYAALFVVLHFLQSTLERVAFEHAALDCVRQHALNPLDVAFDGARLLAVLPPTLPNPFHGQRVQPGHLLIQTVRKVTANALKLGGGGFEMCHGPGFVLFFQEYAEGCEPVAAELDALTLLSGLRVDSLGYVSGGGLRERAGTLNTHIGVLAQAEPHGPLPVEGVDEPEGLEAGRLYSA
jgi:hypothetical protein